MFGFTKKFRKSIAMRSALYLVVGVITATAVACNGSLPTSSTEQVSTDQIAPSALRLSLPLPSLPPLPLGLSCMLSGSISADIGPNGGTITLGAVTLTIPKNALRQPTRIIMLPSLLSRGPAVQFLPEGLRFNPAAKPTLRMNTDCIRNPRNASIVYQDDRGNVLERLRTTQDAHGVSALLEHFSHYAVEWEEMSGYAVDW